ncbi:DUF4340 domain-containing protein [Patescibacteria group bacterium]|nr:DUF4340 domain-containing protein [Patescibacteria group bacterium]MBU4512259.1 DUF4340 domain-containing protein [Patescibacteria group bacterium]MCG2692935.1 DUF4340 domain-containing protein [Candidatus Parcubacteria bacterium]
MDAFQPQKKKKFKTTYILGIVFLVLAGIILITKFPGQNKSETKRAFLKNINIEDISKIEITTRETNHMLQKQDSTWVVASRDNAQANPEDVVNIINTLKELEVGDAVSENLDKQSVFEVDASGIEVKLYQGDNLRIDFFIGKAGPNFDSNFIRRAESNEVYLTKKGIGYVFDKPDFRDLTMLVFNKDEAQEISLTYDETEIVLKKEAETWNLIQPEKVEANQNSVDSFLTGLENLRAVDVVALEEDEDTGLEDPQMEVKVTLEDGSQKVLTIGIGYPQVATYYAKSSDSDKFYIISQWQRDGLKKTVEDFL